MTAPKIMNPDRPRAEGRLRRVLSMSAVLACAACSSEADRLDAEARRLCAIDGGIKVYETVVLPPEKFNSLGQALVPIGKDEKGWGYFVKAEGQRLSGKDGKPQLERFVETVVRSSDGKTLASSVSYITGGGEPLAGLIQYQSTICPSPSERRLAERVFLKGSKS